MQLQLARQASIVVAGRAAVALAPRDAALLAWLALEGPTPRQQLALMLWPDSDPATARNALRQRLFELRRKIGADPVHGSATLALAEGVRHDLADADTVLGDARHEYSPQFADWLQQQREHRTERTRRAVAELEEVAEQAGDYAAALTHAQELLALEPLSEDAHRRVIRLHYLRGDRAAALLAFDRCERTLKDEIGVQPNAETMALLNTIEHGGPVGARRPRAAMPVTLLRPPRLIGRDAELHTLARALDEGAVVLLSGDAGMGKTRLIAELVADRESEPGVLLVTGARPGDTTVPHALAARWLRGLLACVGVRPTAGQRALLARVLPELAPSVPASRDEDRSRVVAAIEELLRQAVGHGLRAIVFDDLQFADDASATLLADCIGGSTCGWIVALRPVELGAASRALVDAQGQSARALMVPLRPLDVHAVAALLGSLAIEDIGGLEQAESLCQRTGGNPLYLLETLKALVVTGSGTLAMQHRNGDGRVVWPRAETVLRLIQQRLARLSPLALKLVRCAAVAGQDLSSPLAAQVLGLRPLDLADAWSELDTAHVLSDCAFAHDLITEAALASVPAAIARPLHAEVASFLEASGGAPSRVAEHWLAAGQPTRAVPQLLQAARLAAQAWCAEESARLHERAAAILLAAGDRRGAFDAYLAATRELTSVATDAQVAALADTLEELAEDDGQRASAALARVAVLAAARRYDDAMRCVLEALPRAAAAGLRDVQVELLWDLVVLHWERRELADAVRHAERALEMMGRVDVATARVDLRETRFKLVHALGVLLQSTGRYADATTRYEEAADIARATGRTSAVLLLAGSLCDVALERGDADSAQRWAAVIGAEIDPHALHTDDRARAYRSRMIVMTALGDLGGALVAAERAAEIVEHDPVRHRVFVLSWQAWLHFELGRRDLAVKTLRGLREQADLKGIEHTFVEAMRIHIGDASDTAIVLERAAAIEDFTLRARALCLAEPGCEPAQILPLLSVTANAARDCGAHGVWVSLQVRRAAALRASGREAEAADIARAVWARLDAGVITIDLFARTAAELCAAVVSSDVEFAQAIALRASAWMRRAAATLPAGWRDNYLARAPRIRDLPAPAARFLSWSPG